MSKVINRLIQDEVSEARKNIDLTTIIAVAVSDYKNLPPLAGPKKDLDLIEDIFVSNPLTRLFKKQQFISLLNPNSNKLREVVLNYAHSRGAHGDILVFYFSGHGSVLVGGEFLLCTIDSTKGAFKEGGIISASAVLFRDIVHSLSSVDVQPVFIIDACFSGAALIGENFQIAKIIQQEAFRFGGSYGLICSSNAELESKDTPEGGIFTISVACQIL